MKGRARHPRRTQKKEGKSAFKKKGLAVRTAGAQSRGFRVAANG